MVTPALKKVLVAALLMGQASLSHSCSDEEVAATAAVVAVGAAAAAISNNRRSGHCEERRIEHCYFDYWGHRQCEWRERRSCHRGHHYFLQTDNPSLSDAMNFFDSVPFDEAIEPSDLASEYTLSMEAANRFHQAMKSAKDGNLQAILDLGLNRKDMELLAQLRVPGDESIDRLAKSLNQRPILTKGMLSRIVVYGHKLQKEECKRLSEKEPNEQRREYRHYCR